MKNKNCKFRPVNSLLCCALVLRFLIHFLNDGPTCDYEFPGSGTQLSVASEAVLGPTLVRLEAVVRAHVSDLQLPRWKNNVFAI